MKYRRFFFLVVIWLTAVQENFSQQNPGAVAGAKLWLKANAGVEVANGNQVLRWNNQSTTGDILTEADTVSKNINRILLHSNEFNFNNALSFAGLDTAYLRGEATTGFNTTSTLFVVCRLTQLPNPTGETLLGVLTSRNTHNGGGGQGISVGGNNASPYYFIDGNGAQAGNTATAHTASGELVLINGIYTDNTSTSNSIINKNGILAQQNTSPTPVQVTPDCPIFEVGGRTFNSQRDRSFYGYIAELIYYPSVLSNVDTKKIESYLALKYGITLGAGSDSNYVSSNGTVIWQGNASFQHDIFGIGRDDASGLTVTESNSMDNGSGSGKGQPGKGNIVIRNPSALANNDFLIIGNNASPLTEQSTELPADAIFSGAMRLEREWQVQHTNNTGTIDLSFYINGLSLSGDTSNIALLVSEGDDDFANGVYRFYNTPVVNDTILTYSGVTLNNNDHFTFVTNLTDPLPQTGDYRSKATGFWKNISSWEIFDGTNWIDATLVPSDVNANLITIRSGHNITQDSANQQVDQLIVDNGAILTIDSTTRPVNGPGTDIIINPTGEIHMSSGSITGGAASMTNTGTISITAGALFVANFTNDGTLSLIATGSETFSIPQFFNNGTISWTTGGTLNFGAQTHLTNNRNLTVNISSNQAINGSGTIINSPGATIDFNQTSSITIAPAVTNNGTMIFRRGTTVFNGSSFTNNAIIKGLGVVTLNGLSNTGFFQPGLSPGILTVQPSYSGGTLDIELVDASGAGTGHDQLAVTGTADISNVTLHITDAGVPVGDYIILTASSGVSGSFLNTASLPPNYTVVVNSNDVILRVNVPLPLTWISFSGKYVDNKVQLNWITGSESNTSYFIIERSTDGRNFNTIGQVTAAGNTISNTSYQFTDAVPVLHTINYYRLKQVDIDGKFSYSTIIRIHTDKANSFKAYITPNPANSVMNLIIEDVQDKEDLLFEIITTNGMLVHSERLSSAGNTMVKSIQRPAISAGIYFYKITRSKNKETYSGRLILQ